MLTIRADLVDALALVRDSAALKKSLKATARF